MNNGLDFLFSLVFKDDVDGVRAELVQGADPNATHPLAGHTLLQVACEANAERSASVLLEAGADPNRRFTKKSLVSGAQYENRVALMYARSGGLIRKLVDAGANVDAADSEGWTALSLAVRDGDFEATKALMDCGASKELRGAVLEKFGNMCALSDERGDYLRFLAKKDGRESILALIAENEKVRNFLRGC